jgi:hypothetical protein
MKYANKKLRFSARLSAVLIAFLFAACASGPSKITRDIDYGKVDLNGMIYSKEGLPVQNARLTVDNGMTVLSDFHGRFTFIGLTAGEHAISVTCPGYERYDSVFTFTSPTENLYVSVTSYDELLAAAEKALQEKKWASADSLTARAIAVEPATARGLFLKACALAAAQRTDRDPEQARAILLALAPDARSKPEILLFLADLCQYDLNDAPSAATYLTQYLALKGDTVAEERLKSLAR